MEANANCDIYDKKEAINARDNRQMELHSSLTSSLHPRHSLQRFASIKSHLARTHFADDSDAKHAVRTWLRG